MRAAFIPRGRRRSLPRSKRRDVAASQDEHGRRVPGRCLRLPRLCLPAHHTVIERWAEKVA